MSVIVSSARVGCSGAAYLVVDGVLPPRRLDIRVALQCSLRFQYVIVQQLQLPGYEVGIGGIAAPGSHVDDVEAAVDGGPNRGELGHNERRRMRCSGYGEVVRQRAFGRWEACETELDVLHGVSCCWGRRVMDIRLW